MNAKKRKIVFGVVIVVVVLVVMFFSQSKNDLIRQLRGPAEGVFAVFTSADKLVVISRANEAYTWDWNDLKKWPIVAKLNAEMLCPIVADKIVYVPNGRGDTIMVTDLKGEKQIKKITLPFGVKCKMVAPSADCSHVAVLLKHNDKNKLAFISPELGLSEPFLITDEDFDVFQIAVSNDGRYVAACGIMGKQAWFNVINTENRQSWSAAPNTLLEDYERYDRIIFSPDSRKLFVSERVRFTHMYDAESVDVEKTFEVRKFPVVAQKAQMISSVEVSPDGLMFAASTEPTQRLFLWNINSGEKMSEFSLPGPVVGDFAFSPNSDMVATSIVVRSTISIRRLPTAQK